jgi:hypothetical protein
MHEAQEQQRLKHQKLQSTFKQDLSATSSTKVVAHTFLHAKTGKSPAKSPSPNSLSAYPVLPDINRCALFVTAWYYMAITPSTTCVTPPVTCVTSLVTCVSLTVSSAPAAAVQPRASHRPPSFPACVPMRRSPTSRSPGFHLEVSGRTFNRITTKRLFVSAPHFRRKLMSAGGAAQEAAGIRKGAQGQEELMISIDARRLYALALVGWGHVWSLWDFQVSHHNYYKANRSIEGACHFYVVRRGADACPPPI